MARRTGVTQGSRSRSSVQGRTDRENGAIDAEANPTLAQIGLEIYIHIQLWTITIHNCVAECAIIDTVWTAVLS